VKIHNQFDVPLPPAEAWITLCDIEEIVPCLPGAEITGKTDDLVYRGHIAVKLGPVALKFRGTAQFTEVDDAERCARIQAQATDEKGRGGVNTTIQFQLEPAAGGSRVFVETTLNLSGHIAQYGRAAGVIEQLADQIVSEFASCLRMKLDAGRSSASDQKSDESSHLQRGKPISAIGLILKLIHNRLTRWVHAAFRRP
jgi:hypothetical protein